MVRADDYKWGLEYEELEGLYMMALHELDDKDERITELEEFTNSVSMLQVGQDVIGDANVLIALNRKAKSLLGIEQDKPKDPF